MLKDGENKHTMYVKATKGLIYGLCYKILFPIPPSLFFNCTLPVYFKELTWREFNEEMILQKLEVIN